MASFRNGRHVGMNYTNGTYENQIEGATTSGDMLGGVEWIFVPENEIVKFTVSNHDTGEFLKKYPWASNVTDEMKYNLNIYHEDSESNRYYSGVTQQQIEPGGERNYLFYVIKNEDGTYKVVLDDLPPTIFNITPKNVTNKSQISAEFIDNPDGSGIDTDSISLTIDGSDATRSAIITGSSVTIDRLLNDGLHEVLLRVGDKAGNKAKAKWNFTLDTTPPEITVSNISTLTNQTVVPIIKAVDARDEKPIISVSLDGSAYNGSPIATEGNHVLIVIASDDLGNMATQTINFTIDKTPPSISITGAENDGFYNTSKSILYSVSDDVDPEPLLSANYVNGAVFNDENDYSVQITATDHAGNVAVKILNFTIDKTPPIVNITSPTNDSYVGHIVKITGDAADLHIKMFSLEIDGISIANTTDHPWDSTKVIDGVHEIRLNAMDKAGNAASTLLFVNVDNTPPDIFNIIPESNAVVNNSYSISADYNDDGSGIDINSFSIWIDGIDETGDALVTNTSMQYKPSLQDGKHILKLSINDIVGNSRIVTTSFELDTTPPEVVINFPANNSFARQAITVSGNANDLHLDTVSIEIDGIKVSSTSTYTWDTTTGKDGTYEIKLNAIDTVKNSASTSINVIVDNTPPIIQLSPPNGTEFYSDQKLTMDYNVSDASSGVASSSVALDGTVVSNGDIVDLRNLSIGNHIIRVMARDNAGNNAETSTTFIVKPLQAVVEIVPRTLNINSSGRWIQAKIKVPGYTSSLIDVFSIRLNEIIPVEIKTNEIEGEDRDSIENDLELKIKFNRTQVQNIVSYGTTVLYISGKVNSAAFLGDSTIEVIENQKVDLDKDNGGKS